MIDLAADHLAYVALSYGIVTVVFCMLVGRAILTAQRLKRELTARGLSDPGQSEDKR